MKAFFILYKYIEYIIFLKWIYINMENNWTLSETQGIPKTSGAAHPDKPSFPILRVNGTHGPASSSELRNTN